VLGFTVAAIVIIVARVVGGSMPGSWDPQVYFERARQWREAAAALPAGETRDTYFAISEGYLKLANLIAIDVTRTAPLPRPSV
jgi:hypothetical protein